MQPRHRHRLRRITPGAHVDRCLALFRDAAALGQFHAFAADFELTRLADLFVADLARAVQAVIHQKLVVAGDFGLTKTGLGGLAQLFAFGDHGAGAVENIVGCGCADEQRLGHQYGEK